MSPDTSIGPRDEAKATHEEPTNALRPPPDISVMGLAIVLLRNRKVLALSCIVAIGLASPWILMQRTAFTARAAFMPQSRGSSSPGLGALAAQFGVAGLLATQAAQPIYLYAALTRSPETLEAVARTQFTIRTDTGTVTAPLFELLNVPDRTEPLRVDKTVRVLADMVSASVDPKTGLVNVAVTTRYPTLSFDIARRILDLVNVFNLQTLQSQAGAERKFAEQQLAEAQTSLRESEDELQQFLQRNHSYQTSPELVFQYDRLERDLTLRQQLYQQLAQAVEQAKIQEVRDIPVITVVEHPEVPLRADGRGRRTKGVLALLLGLTVGVVLSFLREAVAQGGGGPNSELAQARQLVLDGIDDLGRPWRALRKRRGVGPGSRS